MSTWWMRTGRVPAHNRVSSSVLPIPPPPPSVCWRTTAGARLFIASSIWESERWSSLRNRLPISSSGPEFLPARPYRYREVEDLHTFQCPYLGSFNGQVSRPGLPCSEDAVGPLLDDFGNDICRAARRRSSPPSRSVMIVAGLELTSTTSTPSSRVNGMPGNWKSNSAAWPI
jgi:hypothetical protein